MFDKIKTLSFDKWVQIKKPTYLCYKITPHISNRNTNTITLHKMITNFYKALNRKIYRENKKIIIETNFKLSYIIDITHEDVAFYFIFPEYYRRIVLDKLYATWKKATYEIVDIPTIPRDMYNKSYKLYFSNPQALSLGIDGRSNMVLDTTLNVMDIMTDNDRVLVVYNFHPTDNRFWIPRAKGMIKDYLDGTLISTHTPNYFFIQIMNELDKIIRGTLEGLGIDPKNKQLDANLSKLFNTYESISRDTQKKVTNKALDTQIAIISLSNSLARADTNGICVAQSYHMVDGDNQLLYDRIKSIKRIDKYNLPYTEKCKLSPFEFRALVQQPGKSILNKYQLTHKVNTENKIDNELTKGYIKIGKALYQSNTIQTYYSAKGELPNLPSILMSPMGGGKTTMLTQYAKDVIDKGEGLIVIDFIKNCELVDSIARYAPKEKVKILDLSNCKESFAFNELSSSSLDIYKSANNAQQEYAHLINAISEDDNKLTPQMRALFTSAADVVLIQPNTSLKDIVDVLENYEIRHKFIDLVPKDNNFLQDKARLLCSLDDIDKKGNPTTKYNKIEYIITRINLLREKLELYNMYYSSPKNNLNFVEEMDKGSIILIKMPSSVFSTEEVRNILVTYYISKIWLAVQIRGAKNDNLKRCHLLLDEIFQAPTSYETLRKILKQCRKFHLRLIFTCQMLGDLDELKDGLKSAGCSYLLLQGTDKANYFYLQKELEYRGITLDDLLALKQYHSINLIKTTDSYCAYISDLTIKE